MPSPLHRDPIEDGDDYGCFTDEANAMVAQVVEDAIEHTGSGTLGDGRAVVAFVRSRLTKIHGAGATDTVVKENVFYALDEALSAAGIRIEPYAIYGW